MAPPTKPDTVQNILRDYEFGCTVCYIARANGVSVNSVMRIDQRSGLPRRRPKLDKPRTSV